MKQGKKEEREMVNEYGGYDVKEAPSRSQTRLDAPPAAARRNRAPPKPVDEDLYKISPNLLYARTKKVVVFIYLISSLVCVYVFCVCSIDKGDDKRFL